MRPGTVSKILWHFTGGPLWDAETNKQLTQLKPAKSGYDALCAILSSRELRVGSYHEIVKLVLPTKTVYDIEKRARVERKNYEITVRSSPVCCVADIPLQHLGYHAQRYGKIALGFHRDSVVGAGFNPVMYTQETSTLIKQIYDGYASLDDLDVWEAKNELEGIQSKADDVESEHDIDTDIDTSGPEMSLDWIGDAVAEVTESFQNFLAYIKTFDSSEFDTIYCEREWRSTLPFKFLLEDIAMVILPKQQEGFAFYEDFIGRNLLPRDVMVGCWEDLVEH